MGTSDEIVRKSSKPFVGEKCLVTEDGGRPTMCTIRKWEIGKDGKPKFTLNNNWVCDVETITVIRSNKQIKPNEVLETVNKYLMEQELQKSAGPMHRDTADHNGRKLKSLNWILQEPPRTSPRFGNVRLGAVVDVLPVDGFDPVVRNGIVRWIGTCGDGIFKAVVEHVSCDASGLCKSGPGHDCGRSDGVEVNGKWLWRSSTGRCCHWVNVDLIEFHSDVPLRSADVETRQLENIPVLGTFVRFNDPTGHSVSARVLWMGLILGQECVLLEKAELVEHKQLYRQFPVDPRIFYPACVRRTGLEDFIFLPRRSILDSCSDQPQSDIPQPAALNSMNSQQQSSVSNGVETVQPYCLMFNKTEYTKHLEDADLGYTVFVKGSGTEWYKGILCWIGVNIRENRWLVGVELSSKIRIQGREATDGTFQGQQLWFLFQPDAVCYLLPAEMVTLSKISDVGRKIKKGCNNALKALFGDDDNNINLIGSELILGQHVRVGPEQCLGCIVWTGQLDNKNYVVVKLAHPDVPWTQRRTNPYDPADVTTNTKIPGFYGDLIVIQPVAVRPLEHQLHVPRVEKENDKLLGKLVRVDIGDGRFENGIVRWTGTIDGGFLQMGIEMQIPQRPPANELVLAAVLHSLKSKLPEEAHLWILPRTMRIQEQRVVQRKLPAHIMPLGLELGRSMKVTYGDGDNLQMIFGVVMWTGLVDGQWKVALKTMEPLPPRWVQYSEGAVELNLPPERTLVVDPINVSIILQKDEAMKTVVEMSADSRYKQLRELGRGSFGIVYLTENVQTNAKFAMKIFYDNMSELKIEKEIHLLTKLQHPHLVQLHEVVNYNTKTTIVMEFCEQGDLRQFLQGRNGKVLPEKQVWVWTSQLMSAVAYLCEKKIVHRDIKPANVLLASNCMKLADFGLGLVLEGTAAYATSFGTLQYMAPELFHVVPRYTFRSDMFAVGCVVYEMCALKPRFAGALGQIIELIKENRHIPLSDAFSQELRSLVQDMMSSEPKQRPLAADILRSDLLKVKISETRPNEVQ